MSRPLRSRYLAVTAIAVACFAASCGGGGSSTDDTSTTVDPMTTDPRLLDEQSADPELDQFAFGTEVTVEDGAIVPGTTVAKLGNDITFLNATAEPVILEFVNGPYDDAGTTQSPVVEPGGRWTFTPNRVVSHRVAVAERPEVVGTVQIEPADED